MSEVEEEECGSGDNNVDVGQVSAKPDSESREVSSSEDDSSVGVDRVRKLHKLDPNNSKRKVLTERDDEEEEEDVGVNSSQRRSKHGKESSHSKETHNNGLKLCFRHLPPTLTSEEFLELLGEVPDYDYYSFKPAEKSRGHLGFAAAFINFIDKEDGLIYEEKFNNYMVLDLKGNEHFMSVSIALDQSIPKPSKEDPLMGTIENTDSFKAFLEKYEQVEIGVLGVILNEDGSITTDLMLREIEEKNERKKHDVETTPLLEFIRDKHKQDRILAKEMREKEIEKAKEKARLAKQDRRVKDRERKERKEKERKERRAKEREKRNVTRGSNNEGRTKDPGEKRSDLKKSASETKVHSDEASGIIDKGEKEVKQSTSAANSRSDARKRREDKYLDSKSKAKSDSGGGEVSGSTRREREYPKERDGEASRRGNPKDKPPSYSQRKPEDDRTRRGGNERKAEDDRSWRDNERKPEDERARRRNDRDRERVDRQSSRSSINADSGNRPKKDDNSKGVCSTSVEKLSKSNESLKQEPSSSLDPNEKPDQEKKEPKKRIVKKIIRVRKLKSSDAVDGGKEKGTSTPDSSRPVSRKSDGFEKASGESSKVSKSGSDRNLAKPSDGSAKEDKSKSGDSAVEKDKDARRKGRPDMQIYRPGGLRQGTGPAGSSSSDKISERPPRPPRQDRVRDRGQSRRYGKKGEDEVHEGSAKTEKSTTEPKLMDTNPVPNSV